MVTAQKIVVLDIKVVTNDGIKLDTNIKSSNTILYKGRYKRFKF